MTRHQPRLPPILGLQRLLLKDPLRALSMEDLSQTIFLLALGRWRVEEVQNYMLRRQ